MIYHWDTDFNQTWLFPYTITLPSGNGQHVLHVYANDTAGNVVYKKFVLITDDTLPGWVQTKIVMVSSWSTSTFIL